MPYERGGYALNARHSIAFQRKDFLKVRCLDDEGQPLAGRPYVVTLPNGEQVRGELDDDGWAIHEDVRPGECHFRLLDAEIVQPPPGAQTHWIDVVVKDEEGRPLVGEDYVLGTGDGKVRSGRLDHEGRCLVERLPAGPCFFALKSKEVEGKGQVRFIRLKFTDDDGDPLSDAPFELRVGDQTFSGVTGADGRVIADVPIQYEEGELLLWPEGDKDEEPFSWPLSISEVASASPD